MIETADKEWNALLASAGGADDTETRAARLSFGAALAEQFRSLASADSGAAPRQSVEGARTLIVGLFGIIFLREHPSPGQWFGILLTVIGVAFYFLPIDINRLHIFGLLVAFGGVLTNAASALLGRQVNRLGTTSPLVITFISMGICAIFLVVLGILTQGSGRLDLQSWLLIGWLAIVNTAFAFTLWNHTLRTLSAVESSIINSLMMPQRQV